MDVESTDLPGIGLRHEFRTGRGQNAAVISHHTSRRDVVVYHRDDPDTALATLTLTADEANGLAELLGTARIVERLARLQKQATGLVTSQTPISGGSPYDGRLLGDTQARTRTVNGQAAYEAVKDESGWNGILTRFAKAVTDQS